MIVKDILNKSRLLIAAMLLAIAVTGFMMTGCMPASSEGGDNKAEANITTSDVPEFTDEPYVVINDNEPYFEEEELTTESYEEYEQLDELGRCGTAKACIGRDIMPTEERGSIGMIKPSGWQTVRYDNVEGKYLYNRCHLIGYQLSGENANEENLITGTRYMNVQGMLPFEDMVAEYVETTGNHVLYRVIPIFEGDNLVASGVEMEALSVEDKGAGVKFNIYAYDEQPGIIIDHKTGDSRQAEISSTQGNQEQTYILNTSSGKFHYPSCSGVKSMSEKNRLELKETREGMISHGYSPCGMCNP